MNIKSTNFLNEIKYIFDSCVSYEMLESLSKFVTNTEGKIIILGNGGSNAVASHIAEDYSKALRKPTLSFSDAARLTCYANDYGYEEAFKYFLIDFADKKDLIILISSSGNSENIINCAEHCIENNLSFISMTGFSENNKLKNISKEHALLNIWVNSTNYGVVEISHEAILHSII